MDRHVTDEVTLGTLSLSNRVIFGAHRTNLCIDREAGDPWVDYFVERSRGGSGAIVTETMSIAEEDWPYEYAPLLERSRRGIEVLSHQAHREGSAVFVSLGHAGGEGVSTYSQRALVGPSDAIGLESNEPAVPLEDHEIAMLVESFARATADALACGVDGVEINVGDRSILRQFFSPLTNDRHDRYGHDRAALIEEVLHSVRARAGDAVVGMKLCVDEQLPWGGIRIDDTVEGLHRWLPMLDYLTVTAGSSFARGRYRPDFRHPDLANLSLLETLDAALSLGTLSGPMSTALVLSGGIRNAEHVTLALRAPSVTLLEITRAQIADPGFVTKLGRGTTPRPCLGCNQGCTGEDVRNFTVQCLVNPSPPQHTFTITAPTRTQRTLHSPKPSIHVIGAGIAGLEFALCSSGSTVHLYERSSEFGGMVKQLSTTAPGHYLNPLLRYYRERLAESSVITHLNCEITTRADLVAPGDSDIVIDARGALEHDGGFGEQGCSVGEIISSYSSLKGKSFLLVDDLGDEEGQYLAELLIGAGTDLTIVTRDPVIGSRRADTGDMVMGLSRIRGGQVTTHTLSTARASDRSDVLIEGRFGGPFQVRSVNGIVVTGARRGRHTHHPLPFDTTALGDALAPRSIRSAILDARMLAKRLNQITELHS
jgi:2,4-dienoyl-CoA reductase (NADPH2)